MKTTLQILTVVSFLLLLGGCASKHYQVAPEIYRERVKVLGVLPLMVDAESTIQHPQRQEVVAILQQSASEKYLRLSAQLSARAGYNEVRPVIIDPPSQQKLFTGTTLQIGKDGRAFRRYQPDPAAVSELVRVANVDALLVVILNGVESKGKRWERLGPRYLESNFNDIQASALVLASSGEILWEKSGASGAPLVELQYVGFDEAFYNHTDQVPVHFLTPDGLRRVLQASDKGLLEKEAFSTRYRILFDTLSEGLAVGKFWQK
jgi:hypothetical protein